MSKFTTRIALQDARPSDYVRLTTELKKASFTTLGRDEKSGDAAFTYEHKSISDVIQKVVKAVTSTGKKFSFTVVRDKNIKIKKGSKIKIY